MDIAEAADHVVRSRHLEHASTDLAVAIADFVDHRFQRDLEREQPIRIELDLVLLYEAADSGDLRNPWHGFERIAHVPILQAAEVGETVSMTLVDECIFVHPARAGCVRPDHGIHASRKLACNLLEVFQHAAARPIDVGAVFEHDEHIRVVGHRLRANRLHMRRRKHRGDDRIGHLILDEIGRLPHPFGVDDHLDVGDVRQRVERNSIERPDACKYERQHAEEQHEAVRITPVDSSFDHASFLTSPWSRWLTRPPAWSRSVGRPSTR